MHEEKIALVRRQIEALAAAVASRNIRHVWVVACGGSLATLDPFRYILTAETDKVSAAAVNAAGETLFSSYYSREKALAVLHLLRQYDTMIEVFYGGRPYAPADKLNRLAYDYYRIEPIYHPVMAASRVPCTDLEALLSGDEKTEMFNIFFHLDDERRAFIDRATELFPELICTYSMQSNLEILRRGVDKGSALQKLAEHLGLAPEQVIAVGDSRNDLSMIRYAGTGLAVANACDELKQAANAVACTSDAGVLSYIYHHFVE